MSAMPPPKPAETRQAAPEGQLTEWLLRVFAVLALMFGLSGFAHAWWLDTSRWTVLCFLVTETITLLLVIFARRALARDLTPLSIVVTTYAVVYFVFLSAEHTHRIIPEAVGLTLQLASLAWQLWSKITLGRSFGLLPARRSVVTAGPYKVVRHPIYLGYLVAHIGFLLANASLLNTLVLGLLYVAQVVRIEREEAVLAQSADYQDFQQRVRWRLVPGLY